MLTEMCPLSEYEYVKIELNWYYNKIFFDLLV
jgi:hypothetical protein